MSAAPEGSGGAPSATAAAQATRRAPALNLDTKLQVTEQLAYTRLLLEVEHAQGLRAGELKILRTVLWHLLAGSRPKSRELRAGGHWSMIAALKAKEWLGCSIPCGRVPRDAPSWFLRVPAQCFSRYSELVVEAREEIYAFCIANPQDESFPK